jgi:glucosamine kinase
MVVPSSLATPTPKTFVTSSTAAVIRYVVGVDGGGTGTRARVTARTGEVIGYADAGPSGLGQGIDQAWSNVLAAIASAMRIARLSARELSECALGLGVAGANVRARRDAFAAASPAFARLALDTDAYAMLLGAHRGRAGCVVAAGTGSIGTTLRADGSRIEVGGWGFPVGDEGSGAWLGLNAVRRAQHAIDGLAPAGALAEAVLRRAGATREALLAWCESAGQRAYAELAPLVFEAAEADPFASELLDRGARGLAALAHALDRDGALPLVVTGSVGRRLVPRLPASLRSRLVEPAGDAVDGALLLIRRALERS